MFTQTSMQYLYYASSLSSGNQVNCATVIVLGIILLASRMLKTANKYKQT